MRFQVFLSGAAVLALGGAAMHLLERPEALAFLQGALTLGGGLIICGLFSLNAKWHGLIGAGILGLLGAARGLGNLPDLLKLVAGDRSRGAAPALELGTTLICGLLLWRVLRALQCERTRRLLEEEP